MKYLFIFSILLINFNIYPNNIWITQRASEFTTASGQLISVGTRTRGYAMGTEQGSQGTSPYCFVMLDGMNWENCSPNLTGPMKFVTPAKVLPDGRMVGVITEIQGWTNVLSSFIVSDDLQNFIPVYFFDQNDPDDTTSGYPRSLSVVGDNIWLGTKNGKIKKSPDMGITWKNITLSSVSDMQISMVVFTDELNGFAGGGVISEDTDWDGNKVSTVEKAGAIWKTSDGGETWETVLDNVEILPLHIIETSSGRFFLKFHDSDTIDSDAGSKRIVWSDDKFISFKGYNDSFDIPVPSGNFSMGNTLGMDGGATDEIWVAGYCGSGFNFNACTIDTIDGGETWWEKIVPDAMKLGPISVLSSNHVYIAGEFKAMYKWGDPNEDFTEPEEPEHPDEEVVEAPDDSNNGENGYVETPDDPYEKTDEFNDDVEYFDDEGCSCTLIY